VRIFVFVFWIMTPARRHNLQAIMVVKEGRNTFIVRVAVYLLQQEATDSSVIFQPPFRLRGLAFRYAALWY